MEYYMHTLERRDMRTGFRLASLNERDQRQSVTSQKDEFFSNTAVNTAMDLIAHHMLGVHSAGRNCN